MLTLTNKQARQFILLKHGLLGAHKFIGKQGALEFVRQAGCIQFDPVDSCGKNAELTLQSRVKNFTKQTLSELLYTDRSLVDFPDKNLSIFPTEDWPYFQRYRQAAKDGGRNFPELEELEKQVDFSDVYYAGEDAQNYVLTMKSSGMKKTEDIKGKKIGTQMGTIQESILNSLQDEYKLKLDKRKAYSDMVLEMKKGVIDAMVVEKAVAEELAADNEDLSYYKFEAGAELAGNAMIFQKDNKLKDEFNKAIKTMKENGKMDELVKKYFK